MFWDRFVRRVYFGFTGGYPPGRHAAGVVLECAYGHHLLAPRALDDLSAALCFLLSGRDSSFLTTFRQEYIRRRLWRTMDWLWPGLCPKRFNDLVAIAVQCRESWPPEITGDEPWRAALDAVAEQYLVPVRTFLERFLWASPTDIEVCRQNVLLFFDNLGEKELIECRGDSSQGLFRKVLLAIRPPGRRISPGNDPAWLATLDPAERSFLKCGLKENAASRCLLCLSFYAELDTEQIAGALQAANQGWTVPRVEGVLQRVWQSVLGHMASQRPCK